MNNLAQIKSEDIPSYPYWVIANHPDAWLHPDAGIDRLAQDEPWGEVVGERRATR